MPKVRPHPGTRSVQGRLLVLCEGAKDKSESAYFKALMNDRRNPDNRLEIKVVDTNANTKHLLANAKINAQSCRKYQMQSNQTDVPIYEMNPYTNVDELVTAIERFSVEESL